MLFRSAVAAARSLGIATVQIDETVSPQALSIFGHIAQNPIRSQHKEQRFALLMQTSGTTSSPKLVLLTHANILSAARGIVRAFGLGPDDLCFNPMPLHHVHGLISAGISSLLATSTCYLASSFTPKSFNAAFIRSANIKHDQKSCEARPRHTFAYTGHQARYFKLFRPLRGR